jgi:Ca2+-binding RTX toxin-like protein
VGAGAGGGAAKVGAGLVAVVAVSIVGGAALTQREPAQERSAGSPNSSAATPLAGGASGSQARKLRRAKRDGTRTVAGGGAGGLVAGRGPSARGRTPGHDGRGRDRAEAAPAAGSKGGGTTPAGADAAREEPGSVSVSGATITVKGGPGQANRIDLASASGSYQISDTNGRSLNASQPCDQRSSSSVSCPASGVSGINVELGDGDDLIEVVAGSLYANVDVDGGSGDDTIKGSGRMFGGAGNDRLSGSPAMDGGDGDDRIDATSGSDQILGGAGDDRIDAGAGHDMVNGAEGNDVIDGGAGVGMYGDILVGADGNDTLRGSPAVDRLIGGAGADRFDGGPGFDDIAARDGESDQFADCSGDQFELDELPLDPLSSSCGTLNRGS